MIVVDTNILAYFWIPGEFSEIVEKVYHKSQKWVVPFLWRSEFRSVLAGYVRLKGMIVTEAIEIFEKAENQVRGNEFSVSHIRVLNLIGTSKLSAYDCEFVSLAEHLSIPFVTTDKRIVTQFPKIAFQPEQYLRKA
jgi:predicted nucleic acid-binding protein